ncbi:MAG: large conductance mechanosensitive channel protein MscL [Armatimonadetes bacterium]|nr:large conductance mechanosensitive channel protein MscL [Armatimonadota bacterium]
MLKEFKDFINRGNVMELAIGVMIAAAFGKIVDSIVAGLITPIISLVGLPDFKGWGLTLRGGDKPVIISIGDILNNVISFIAVAMVLFMIVKAMNKMKKEAPAAPAAPPEPTNEEKLLTEIRDLLKK